MALRYTSEQEQIRAETRKFLAASYRPEVQRGLLQKRGAYDSGFWQTCADMGWTGAAAPSHYGGLDLGALDVCIIAEECGRYIAAAPFLAANYAALSALVKYGAEEQRAALIPGLVSGAVRFALGFCEDEDGLPHAPTTKMRNGALTGRKVAVVGAAAATHALVLADTGIVLVDLAGAGVRRDVGDTIDNSRCTADLHFDATPATFLAAAAEPLRLLAIQAVVTAFEQIGGAEAVMQRAQNYANTREAFGQLIGKFQAIKHRIAEMYLLIELARGNALLATASLGQDAGEFVALAGAARLAAGEAFEFASAQSIQTHGAIGATWEHDLHLYLRRARALAVELGSPLFWEDVVVEALQSAHP